jgi:hypothetical protein
MRFSPSGPILVGTTVRTATPEVDVLHRVAKNTQLELLGVKALMRQFKRRGHLRHLEKRTS